MPTRDTDTAPPPRPQQQQFPAQLHARAANEADFDDFGDDFEDPPSPPPQPVGAFQPAMQPPPQAYGLSYPAPSPQKPRVGGTPVRYPAASSVGPQMPHGGMPSAQMMSAGPMASPAHRMPPNAGIVAQRNIVQSPQQAVMHQQAYQEPQLQLQPNYQTHLALQPQHAYQQPPLQHTYQQPHQALQHQQAYQQPQQHQGSPMRAQQHAHTPQHSMQQAAQKPPVDDVKFSSKDAIDKHQVKMVRRLEHVAPIDLSMWRRDLTTWRRDLSTWRPSGVPGEGWVLA